VACHAEALAEAGEIISAFPQGAFWKDRPLGGEVEHFRTLAMARAVENQAYVIASNRVGKDDDLWFCGSSAIIDPRGVVIAVASADREEVIHVDVSEELVLSVRSRVESFAHRRQDLYKWFGFGAIVTRQTQQSIGARISFSRLVSTANENAGHSAYGIEYLQASAKAIARCTGGKDFDFGSDLGSERPGRLSCGQRVLVPLEINRSDLAHWQRHRGFSKRVVSLVNKTALNSDAICHIEVDEVEPCSLTHG
jgi:Carbon-nitrogen hydrolase